MAAKTLPEIGSTWGPCLELCGHTDCLLTREMADAHCRVCADPIGYRTRFYAEDAGGLVHARCVELD